MIWEIVSVLTGIALGCTGSQILSFWKQRRRKRCCDQILSDIEQKGREREREISLNVLPTKVALDSAAKAKVQKIQENIAQVRHNLDSQDTDLQVWEESLTHTETSLQSRREKMSDQKQRYDQVSTTLQEVRKKNYELLLERSHADIPELKRCLVNETEEMIKLETARHCSRFLETVNHYAEPRGVRLLSAAIQRYRISHAAETYSSTVYAPDVETARQLALNPEIAALFRQILEVEIVLDSKDAALIAVHSTDGYRREIARRALDAILERHCEGSAQIQELLLETQNTTEMEIEKVGKEVGNLFEISLTSEIAQLLGRLKYRTSFGQNVLSHCIEVAYVAKLLAMELGLDSRLACCAGLLHDIGKAVDQEKSGTHAEIGGDILKEFYTEPEILEGVSRHHEDIHEATPYATIISAADAISASRPGARRETFEIYIKRLENLEAIATRIPGVTNAFAISAGRELRVMVNPGKISDGESAYLAKKIAQEIEQKLHYPGQIKITVIREMKTELYTH